MEPIRRPYRLRSKILLALTSLLLTLLALEFGSRWLLRSYVPRQLRDGIYVNTLPLLSGLAIGETPKRRGAILSEEKERGELRVFVFGESSVVGVPWGLAGSPATMLHDLLRETYPSRRITVVNMGHSGSTMLDTYYYLTLLKRFRPDVVIFYQGTNDRWDVGREGCLLLEHPRTHAVWRWMTERSSLLFAAHVLGPSAFRARENRRGRTGLDGGCSDAAFGRWSDLVVERARAMGAHVITTSPVNSYAQHVDAHYRDRPASLYQRLVQCRLTEGCNVSRLLPDQGREITRWQHEHLLRLATQWRHSARRFGAQFIDFHAALRALAADDWLDDTFIEDEVHLSLEGYLFLARFWLAQTRSVLEHRPQPDPTAPNHTDVLPYAEVAGERTARLLSARVMLMKRFFLVGAAALRRYGRQYDDPAARLALGWLRRQVGLRAAASKSLDSQRKYVFEVLGISPRLRALRGDSPDSLPSSTGIVPEQESQRHPPDRCKVRRGVGLVNGASVLSHLHVERPVQAVLDAPVFAGALGESLRRRSQTRQEDVQLARGLVLHRASALDERDAPERRPLLARKHTGPRRDRPCLARLDPPVALVLGPAVAHGHPGEPVGARGREVAHGHLVGRAAIGLQVEQIVRLPRHDRLRRLAAAVRRVGGHQRALEFQHREQIAHPRDLLGRALDGVLGQQEALLARPHVDQVELRSERGPSQRAPQGLAVEGDDLPGEALREALDPRLHARPERLRVQRLERPVEGALRGHAVGHVEERREPFLPILREVLDLFPTLGPADHRDHRHQDDRQQRVVGAADDPRVFKRLEVLPDLAGAPHRLRLRETRKNSSVLMQPPWVGLDPGLQPEQRAALDAYDPRPRRDDSSAVH